MDRFRPADLPRALSGGQQQRVALARTLAPEPEGYAARRAVLGPGRVVAGLDVRLESAALAASGSVTTVMVTHDQDEALTLADHVAMMREGRLEQVDEPARVYDEPASLFVSGFVGVSVVLPGRVVRVGNGDCAVRLDAGADLIVGWPGAASAGTGCAVVGAA